MYTLEQLQQKSINELKEIGWELNVFPKGDRRYRESWIEAIAGVNPPLLQLLEVSAATSVEQVQEPIIETVETSPGVEVDRVQEPISQVAKNSPGVEVDRVQGAIEGCLDINELWKLDQANCPACGGIDSLDAKWCTEYAHGFWTIDCNKCGSTCTCSIEELPAYLWGDDDDEDDDVNKNSPGVEVEALPECSHCFDDGYFDDGSGLIKSCVCSIELKLSRQNAQRAIVPSDLNPILTGIPLSDRFLARYAPPQSETLHYKVTDGYNVDTDGQLSLFEVQAVTEPEPPDPDDFDSMFAFWAAYDAWDKATDDDGEPSSIDKLPSSIDKLPSSIDKLPSSIDKLPSSIGQLTLIDFKVQSAPEPPDPDDFASIDAFQEALARWDAENAEMITVSMDSMCEWAPCPEEWYEPEAESLPLKPSSMMELSPPAIESSSTSDFFIPTFDAWCDRSNGSDEPPDTGIFARRPGPKPPRFPPRAIGQAHTKRKLNAVQSLSLDRSAAPQTHTNSSSIAQVETESKCRANTYPPVIPINNAVQSKLKRIPTKYPETIPILFHRIVAGSSTQPARSPPGGDVYFA